MRCLPTVRPDIRVNFVHVIGGRQWSCDATLLRGSTVARRDCWDARHGLVLARRRVRKTLWTAGKRHHSATPNSSCSLTSPSSRASKRDTHESRYLMRWPMFLLGPRDWSPNGVGRFHHAPSTRLRRRTGYLTTESQKNVLALLPFPPSASS